MIYLINRSKELAIKYNNFIAFSVYFLVRTKSSGPIGGITYLVCFQVDRLSLHHSLSHINDRFALVKSVDPGLFGKTHTRPAV